MGSSMCYVPEKCHPVETQTENPPGTARYIGNSPKENYKIKGTFTPCEHNNKQSMTNIGSSISSAKNSNLPQVEENTEEISVPKNQPNLQISLPPVPREEYDQLDSQPNPSNKERGSTQPSDPKGGSRSSVGWSDENTAVNTDMKSHPKANCEVYSDEVRKLKKKKKNGSRKLLENDGSTSSGNNRNLPQVAENTEQVSFPKNQPYPHISLPPVPREEYDQLDSQPNPSNKERGSTQPSDHVGGSRSSVACSEENTAVHTDMTSRKNESCEGDSSEVHKLKKKKKSGSRKLLENDRIKVMTFKTQQLEKLCKQDDDATGIDEKESDVCPAEFITSVRHIEKCIFDLKEDIKVLTREKNEYLNRLSGLAGAQLTNNNPNIANLNDPNRPMKLAEKYSKIYDDEWTDAMEILEKMVSPSKKDKEMFEYHLYILLKVIYETLKKKAEVQFQRLTEHLFLLNDPSGEQIEGYLKEYKIERQRLIETRKQTAEGVIMLLQTTLKEDSVFKHELLACDPALNPDIIAKLVPGNYFQKCVDICWRFVIQDPPMYLETNSCVGMKLNKETHKEYTVSGDTIKYVVWPALYLYEQFGIERPPLLAKGVVQPK